MAKVNYSIGDTIQYRPNGGGVRTVVVEEKDEDIKRGQPGFAGRCIEGDVGSCWGYDDQVIRVVERCNPSGN